MLAKRSRHGSSFKVGDPVEIEYDGHGWCLTTVVEVMNAHTVAEFACGYKNNCCGASVRCHREAGDKQLNLAQSPLQWGDI